MGLEQGNFDIGGTLFDAKDIKNDHVGDVPGTAVSLGGQ